MNQIFNFKRFAAYFKFDLASARSNYLLSLLIISFIPLWALIVYEVCSLISGNGFSEGNIGLQISSFVTAVVMLWFTAPVKLYGHLTEKKAGSAWVMTPASAFEKFLSLLIITCVILPLAGGILLFAVDAVIALLVPGFNEPILSSLPTYAGMIGSSDVAISPVAFWASWCETILIFTLGSIWFKKGKIGKTFLVSMGILIVLCSITVLIFGSTEIDGDLLEKWFGEFTPKKLQAVMNWGISLIYFVIFGVLFSGIYFRIKTLKH